MCKEARVKRWYALFTKPRREFIVAESLEARGLDTFVPTIAYHGKRGNLLEKPFFPRYVLSRFDWEREGWSEVQWTRGLTRVVTFDGRPAFLPDEHVAYLLERLDRIDGDEFLKIKPGTKVRVTEGPFKDMEAIFDGQLNGEQRVAVLLQILGRQTRVVMSPPSTLGSLATVARFGA
jgi:transcriptional antiterminator RfaH